MSDKLKKIHKDAIKDFQRIQDAVYDERRQCLKDRRFYSIAGGQWEGNLGEQFKNKPKFEMNKIHLSIIRIISEWRNNRITVDFVDKFEQDDEKLADTLDGLYRATEKDSCADESYDNGFEEAVGGGFGAWRLRTEYEDEYDDENELQKISIEPIYDADNTVFFDLGAKRQDKSDAKRAYILIPITLTDFEERYPNKKSLASWDKSIHQVEFDWVKGEDSYLCEHYRIEEQSETIFIYEYSDKTEKRYRESDFENDKDLKSLLRATGAKKVREKKIRIKKVHKYIMSALEIVEDCGYIAGSEIPIVPVYGKRWVVDGIERQMGHVRLAKDAQRLKNMLISKLGEISALSSVEKPIVTPQQINNHKNMWETDNIKNYPYLLLNGLKDKDGNLQPVGQLAYTKPPVIPPALAALLQITEQDMKDLLGNQEKGEEIKSNISGKVVELIQDKLDMQVYIYLSNMAKGIKRSGEIWLGMAKEIYVEDNREIKAIGRDDKALKATINRPIMIEGEQKRENDIANAKYDIAVSVGPSSRSKRASTVRDLTAMMQVVQDPETLQVLSFMAIMNMEGEGIDETREFYRKRLVRMGAIDPTEQEKKEMAEEQANAQPDPSAQLALSMAKNEEAKAAKTEADIELSKAKVEKTEAETIEILAEIRDGKKAAV